MEVENEAISKLIKQIDDAPNGLWDEINFFNAWSRKVLLLNGFLEIDLISFRYFPRKMYCGWRHLSLRMLNKLEYLENRIVPSIPKPLAERGNKLTTAAALKIYATTSYILKFGFNRFGTEAYSTIYLKETRQLNNHLSFLNLYQSSQGTLSSLFNRESIGITELIKRDIDSNNKHTRKGGTGLWKELSKKGECADVINVDDVTYYIEVYEDENYKIKMRSYYKEGDKEVQDGGKLTQGSFCNLYTRLKK